jgi:oxepin-CoA hydrolase/3-oxo-5,6-dehydrosuberyl-CoA semialdehyde dehydrogenase
VVAWDVQVTNQLGELVASYNILTLVLKQPGEGAAGA